MKTRQGLAPLVSPLPRTGRPQLVRSLPLVNRNLVNPKLVNPNLANLKLVNRRLALNPRLELKVRRIPHRRLMRSLCLVNQSLANPKLVKPSLVNLKLMNRRLVLKLQFELKVPRSLVLRNQLQNLRNALVNSVLITNNECGQN